MRIDGGGGRGQFLFHETSSEPGASPRSLEICTVITAKSQEKTTEDFLGLVWKSHVSLPLTRH